MQFPRVSSTMWATMRATSMVEELISRCVHTCDGDFQASTILSISTVLMSTVVVGSPCRCLPTTSPRVFVIPVLLVQRHGGTSGFYMVLYRAVAQSLDGRGHTIYIHFRNLLSQCMAAILTTVKLRSPQTLVHGYPTNRAR